MMLSGFGETRRLGRSGCSVPAFGFGGAHLGELYQKLGDEHARETVEAAWRGGIRYYDTAPWYGHGLSEHRLGEVLRSKPRNMFMMSTKVGRVYRRPTDMSSFSSAPWVGGLPFEWRFDYGYEGVMRSFEDSLMRLGLNRIDLLIIHDLDRSYHADDNTFHMHWRDLTTGGMRALTELKQAGDILAIGAGVNTGDMIAQMAMDLDVDFLLVAMPYTLLDQSALYAGFPECEARGVGIVIGAPFASGLLATGAIGQARYNYAIASADIIERVRHIDRICRKYNVALPAVALQFVLAHPIVASVIPGAAGAQEVRENVKHLAAPIPASLWDELRAGGLIATSAPTP